MNTLARILLACALATNCLAGTALDPSFGDQGRALVGFDRGTSDSMVAGLATLPDGRIVAAATGGRGVRSTVAVVRYAASGAADSSFGTSGRTNTPVGSDPWTLEVASMALQADGRAVVVANTGSAGAVARFTVDGRLDASFNSIGYLVTNLGTSTSTLALRGIAVQADGKILVAGTRSIPGTSQWSSSFLLARFQADGSLDPAFGENGIATAGLEGYACEAWSLAVQADEKLVVGGACDGPSPTRRFAVARFMPGGTLDLSFGGGGIATPGLGGDREEIRKLALQADGKMVALGTTYRSDSQATRTALVRLDVDGSLDAAFQPLLLSPPEGSPQALAILPSGKIALAGNRGPVPPSASLGSLMVWRCNPDGALDPTFNGSGVLDTGLAWKGTALHAQPDGALLVGAMPEPGLIAVLRYRDDGSADPSFNASGFVTTRVAYGDDLARAVAVHDDGSIHVGGSSGSSPISFGSNLGGQYIAVARLDASGIPDRTADFSMGSTSCPYCLGSVNAVGLDASGRALIAGDWGSAGGLTGTASAINPFVMRLATNGSRDSAFAGYAGRELWGSYAAVIVQPDGRILVAGHLYDLGYRGTRTDHRFVVERYTPEGNLDPAFGGGRVTTRFGDLQGFATAAALQPDGAVVVVGHAFAARTQFALVRYRLDGSVESSDVRSLGGSSEDSLINAVAVQPDSAIVVGGAVGGRAFLARFSSPGIFDESFGAGGKVFLYTEPTPIRALALQGDGRILALTENAQLLRFEADGTLDASFGSAGRFALALGAGATTSALAVQRDGRILVAGAAEGADSLDYAIARVDPNAQLDLAADVPYLDFGEQPPLTSSPARPLRLTNRGAADVAISSVSASDGFTVTHDCGTLAPGGSCTAQVVFRPTLAGEAGGSLRAASSGGALAIPLYGFGERSLATHYYRSILRREPDSQGKDFWDGEATRMASLGANSNEAWFAMAMSFFASPEYAAFGRTATEYLRDLYATFFNRAPDDEGLAYWSAQIASGMPREVVLAGFMFSPEFTSFSRGIFGNTAARAEVDVVMDFYRGLLARLPDSAGFSHWVGQFRSAQCQGASAVVAQVEAISSAFAASGEYLARDRTNAQYVGDLYNAFLRRGGELEGVTFWIGQLERGAQTRDQVRRAFVASPEFNARASAIVAQGCLS